MRKEFIADIKKIDKKTLNKMSKTHWYHRELIRYYLRYGSLRVVSRITKIPYGSVYKAIKSAIKWANEKI